MYFNTLYKHKHIYGQQYQRRVRVRLRSILSYCSAADAYVPAPRPILHISQPKCRMSSSYSIVYRLYRRV